MDTILHGDIADFGGMQDILETVLSLKKVERGILRIFCSDSNQDGKIAFSSQRFLTGAKLSGSQETGYSAMKRLLSVQDGRFEVIDLKEDPAEGVDEGLFINLATVLERLADLPLLPDELIDQEHRHLADSVSENSVIGPVQTTDEIASFLTSDGTLDVSATMEPAPEVRDAVPEGANQEQSPTQPAGWAPSAAAATEIILPLPGDTSAQPEAISPLKMPRMEWSSPPEPLLPVVADTEWKPLPDENHEVLPEWLSQMTTEQEQAQWTPCTDDATPEASFGIEPEGDYAARQAPPSHEPEIVAQWTPVDQAVQADSWSTTAVQADASEGSEVSAGHSPFDLSGIRPASPAVSGPLASAVGARSGTQQPGTNDATSGASSESEGEQSEAPKLSLKHAQRDDDRSGHVRISKLRTLDPKPNPLATAVWAAITLAVVGAVYYFIQSGGQLPGSVQSPDKQPQTGTSASHPAETASKPTTPPSRPAAPARKTTPPVREPEGEPGNVQPSPVRPTTDFPPIQDWLNRPKESVEEPRNQPL